MGLSETLNTLGKLIHASVGNRQENNQEDVKTIRDSLEEIDFFSADQKERDDKDEPLGYITGTLDKGIKDFQKENNLKIDGKINPDGETEKTLVERIKEKKQWALPTLHRSADAETNSHGTNLEISGLSLPKEKVHKAFKTIREENKPHRPSKKAVAPDIKQEQKTSIKNLPEGSETIPTPKEKPNALPSVPLPEIEKFLIRHEKIVEHMYLDTEGKVTVGVGHLIPDENAATELPFYRYENNKPSHKATEKEIRDAFQQMKK